MFLSTTKLLLVTVFSLLPIATHAGWQSGQYSDSNGQLPFHIYRSDSATSVPQRVILSLHGCTQSAQEFAEGSRLVELADAENYLMVAPEQTSDRNTFRCWNWFEPGHQSRDSGEPNMFIGILTEVLEQEGLSNLPTYVVGFSAGAAMAVTMNSCFPEVFHGAIASAGMQFKAANSVSSAFLAMSQGSSVDPADSATAALTCANRPLSNPLFLIHGSRDSTVSPVNSENAVAQALITADAIDDGTVNESISYLPSTEENGQSEGGMDYLFRTYHSGSSILAWSLLVDGMSHAWSGGGSGSYVEPNGPPAHSFIQQFIEQIEF